jgi:hypothetical protein
MQRFKQGVTIVPRMFWFADIIAHPKLSIDSQEPSLQNSKRSIRMAKKQYKGL